MQPDDDAIVRALLAAAGIHPPDDEIQSLIQAYSGLRAAAASLYAEEAARYLPAYFPTDEDLEAK